MNTYTKTFAICPHCEAETNFSIDHLEEGKPFGPWYCEACGGGFEGKANGTETVFVKVDSRFESTYDLLVIEPRKDPVYFILSGRRWREATDQDVKFLYEEYSCPENWIKNTQWIVVGKNWDPHGILKFVRSVEQNNEVGEDEYLKQMFPEFLRGGIKKMKRRVASDGSNESLEEKMNFLHKVMSGGVPEWKGNYWVSGCVRAPGDIPVKKSRWETWKHWWKKYLRNLKDAVLDKHDWDDFQY